MKRIISGQRWDTDNAIEICQVYEGNGPHDYRSVDAVLYSTKRSHKFFLAGSGGPMTIFAVRRSDGVSGSEGIIPLTTEQARDYAEKHADTTTIEKYFTIEDA